MLQCNYKVLRAMALDEAADAIMGAAKGLTVTRMAWVSNILTPGRNWRRMKKSDQARGVAELMLGLQFNRSNHPIFRRTPREIRAWARKEVRWACTRYANRVPRDEAMPDLSMPRIEQPDVRRRA